MSITTEIKTIVQRLTHWVLTENFGRMMMRSLSLLGWVIADFPPDNADVLPTEKLLRAPRPGLVIVDNVYQIVIAHNNSILIKNENIIEGA